MVSRKLQFTDLNIDWDSFWKESGNGEYAPDEYSQDILRSVQNDIRQFCQPEYGYEIYPNTDSSQEKLRIGGKEFNAGKDITGFICSATEFAVWVGTAGTGFEDYQKRLHIKGDIVKSFFADLIGTVIAERTGELLWKEIEAIGKSKGMETSHNYNPGHCGWTLTDQHTLFSLLPQNPCGITLTESDLMVPIKSVSGIIAIGNGMGATPHGCTICTKTGCYKKTLIKKR